MGNVINWRGWNITAETANGISNGDITARNRFFNDNYDRIKKMAFNYVRKGGNGRNYGLAYDMVSTVYVDMDVWTHEYKNPVLHGGVLSVLVYKSFKWCAWGGYAYLLKNNRKVTGGGEYLPARSAISLDVPVRGKRIRHQDDNNNALLDFIPAPDYFETLGGVPSADCLAVVGGYLSPRERDFMGFLLDGFAPSVACEHLGIKQHGALSKRIHCKLVKNYAVILDRLALLGVDLPSFAKTAPADLAKALTALSSTPESRAKARKNARLRRERQRALQLEKTA
ncbi:MAG: hypothetical protein K2I20_01510 [Clostridia bacterium]|nr:hypothetical protein [Clostridia bacterium]